MIRQGPPSPVESDLTSSDGISPLMPISADEGSSEPTENLVEQNKFPDKERDEKPADIPNDKDVYIYYFKSIGLLNFLGFLFGGICFSFFFKFSDQWLNFWSSANTLRPNGQVGYYLGIYSLLNFLALISLGGWGYHLYHHVVAVSGKSLHKRLLKTVMHAPFSFIARIDAGVTVNRFSQDILLVDGTLPEALLNTASELFTAIMQIGLICAASAIIVAIFPFIAVCLYLIQRFYLRTSKALRIMEVEAKAPIFGHFTETSNGLTTIRAFGWQDSWKESCRHKIDESHRPYYLLLCVQTWLGLVLNFLVGIISVVVLVIAIQWNGHGSIGSLAVALVNITTLGETLQNLIISWTGLETTMGAIARLKTFNDQTPQEAIPEADAQSLPIGWPQKGGIGFRNVFASYHSDSPVIKGANFLIEPGQKVALCGKSGSGKSSLLLALLGMIDVHSGEIEIDGVDLSKLRRHDICRYMNVIPQDPYFLPGKIRYCLDMHSLKIDDELASVLSDVGLWEQVLEAGGLDAEMNLEKFSVGERQLLRLASSFVNRKPGQILLLDEAMSRYVNSPVFPFKFSR